MVFLFFLGVWQTLPNLSRVGAWMRRSGERLEEISDGGQLSWGGVAKEFWAKRSSGKGKKTVREPRPVKTVKSVVETPPAPPAQTGQRVSGIIFHVSDGDTADLRTGDGVERRLRFYGVDAPESSQEFGGDARKYVSRRLLSKRVEVLLRYNDQYGRYVSTIFLDGKDFSLELLEGGFVWHYVQYCDDPSYAAAQERARKALKGLWGEAAQRGVTPVPPWTYRKQNPRRK